MPRLNLVYIRSASQNVGSEAIHYERIKAYLEIGRSKLVRKDCMVDTGSVFSVFPELIWKTFEKEIAWLYVPGGSLTLPTWISKVTGLGAQSIDCRIGMVRTQIIELPFPSPLRRSPAVEIIAKFPYDAGAFTQILFGLGGKAFLDWNLTIDSKNAKAWLEY